MANVADANIKEAVQILLDHIKPKTTGGHEIDQYHNDIVPDVTEKQNVEEPRVETGHHAAFLDSSA